MRLKTSEIDAIRDATRIVMGTDVSLHLFGSRTDPMARGGDIDLLVLADSPRVDDLRQKKRRLIMEIQRRIGERRIDCTVANRDFNKQSEFVRTIMEKSEKLLGD